MSATHVEDSSTPSDDVVVTVTTSRTDQTDGVREATVRGPFDTALPDALAERLEQWALEQVLSGLLSRRPARGEPGEWFDRFNSTRTIRVSVRPTVGDGACKAVTKVRGIPGLYIPAELQTAAAA